MKVYTGFDFDTEFDNLVLALGNFDGVHLGHRELIRTTLEIARREKGIPGVFTFDPHPLKVLQPENCPPMLLTKKEKIKILSELGIELLIISPFSDQISTLSPERFISEILVDRFKVKTVVVGYNYNFGHRGAGSVGMLSAMAEKYGFATCVVPPVKCGDTEVSSTYIRSLLLEGDIAKAARFLGYSPFIKSTVVCGRQVGSTIGYPTANLNLPEDVLVPATGVYAVRIFLGDRCFAGVANIGVKPTFGVRQPKNLEVHIFDFSENLYGEAIEVHFVERIRSEEKFSSVEDLVTQLSADALKARQILGLAL